MTTIVARGRKWLKVKNVDMCPPFSASFPIEARSSAPNRQPLRVTTHPGYDGLDISATCLVRLAPNMVDFANPLYLHWMYRVPGRTGFIMGGTSTNQVYVG